MFLFQIHFKKIIDSNISTEKIRRRKKGIYYRYFPLRRRENWHLATDNCHSKVCAKSLVQVKAKLPKYFRRFAKPKTRLDDNSNVLLTDEPVKLDQIFSDYLKSEINKVASSQPLQILKLVNPRNDKLETEKENPIDKNIKVFFEKQKHKKCQHGFRSDLIKVDGKRFNNFNGFIKSDEEKRLHTIDGFKPDLKEEEIKIKEGLLYRVNDKTLRPLKKNPYQVYY
jgi:hypothetical protein